ncbi:unnamed protein product [Gadus morhua 'NCC']
MIRVFPALHQWPWEIQQAAWAVHVAVSPPLGGSSGEESSGGERRTGSQRLAGSGPLCMTVQECCLAGGQAGSKLLIIRSKSLISHRVFRGKGTSFAREHFPNNLKWTSQGEHDYGSLSSAPPVVAMVERRAVGGERRTGSQRLAGCGPPCMTVQECCLAGGQAGPSPLAAQTLPGAYLHIWTDQGGYLHIWTDQGGRARRDGARIDLMPARSDTL